MSDTPKYYVVVHPSATFLMEIIGNRVTKAPDLAQWAMNRNIRGVKQWYKTHGCQCYEVQMP